MCNNKIINVGSLFDLSVEAIIRCPKQLGKAALRLPRHITHYLLYLSVSSGHLEAIEQILEHWPHKDLTFDFYSNPLCRFKRDHSGRLCLKACEYFNPGLYCTEEFSSCIPSIAVGLFRNISVNQNKLATAPSGANNPIDDHESPSFPLQTIDLVNVRVTTEKNVDCLLELSRGNFPVKHPIDYLTQKDTNAYQTTKPKLHRLKCSTRLPKLRITIAITSSRILGKVLELQTSTSTCFKLEVAGVDLTNLSKKRVPLALRSFSHSSCYSLDHIFVHLHDLSVLSCEEISSLPFSPSTCLWLITPTSGKLDRHLMFEADYARVFSYLTRATPSLRGLVIDSEDTALLNVLSSNDNLLIQMLSMSRREGPSTALDLSEKTKSLLPILFSKNASNLNYVHMCGSYLSMLYVDTLRVCSNLRVLSVTQYNTRGDRPINIQSNPSTIFKAISCLPNLEYFEWAEIFNLRTADLLVLHRVLSNSLPHLRHCHLQLFQVLLSTTDLNCDEYKPIMDLLWDLLNGLQGDDRISTYKFSLKNVKFEEWMRLLRPSVCFHSDVLD